MTRKQLILIILITLFLGGMSGILYDRIFLPNLSKISFLRFLSKLRSDTPIVITRKEEVHLNEGVNLIDLTKQAQGFTVSIYNSDLKHLELLGTGIILTSDGLMTTAESVVNNQKDVIVITNEGKVYKALVRALDRKSNLAIISALTNNLPVAPFADAFDLQTAQRIMVLGKGTQEFTRKFEAGLVTKRVSDSVDPNKAYSSENFEESFETNAKINQDYIGGPVINLDGKIVGMIVNSQGSILPSEYIKTGLDSFLQNGKVIRPYLGISYLKLSLGLAQLRSLNQSGALVESIEAGSPALQAQLKTGDLVIQVDQDLVNESTLEQLLNRHNIGDIKFKVIRDGKELELTVKLIAK